MVSARTWIFENGLGALAYRTLVEQPLWRRHIERLLEHFDPAWEAPRVLDLGTGPGVSAFVLAEALGPAAEVVGVDLAAPMIARAEALRQRHYQHLPRLRFLEADAAALPFADASFDAVTGHSFLYIVPDRPRVLAEIARVLAPGGRVVLMEPAREGDLLRAAVGATDHLGEAAAAPLAAARFAASMVLWRAFSSLAGRLTPDEVERLFSDAGLAPLACAPTLGGLGLHCVGGRPPLPVE